MKLANFTVEQLKTLPLRAIVAFAARCARRVERFAQLPEGDPRRESRREAIEAALRMAESFARGTDAPPDESVIAAIDASRDAGGELAAAAAASAVAQAAHAAASAWHAGSQVAEANGICRLESMTSVSAAAGSFVTSNPTTASLLSCGPTTSAPAVMP